MASDNATYLRKEGKGPILQGSDFGLGGQSSQGVALCSLDTRTRNHLDGVHELLRARTID
ncbi:hypothetical protein SERLA73DRAFT_140336 [Serpula lacrymans var. lacrymans S7.3]|uniref:Uncharacterized protein n=2 Tax=Serpula lacrymans var. lacrymans TaxID=341189 RepID=F8Q537_SERL3|nr:uncharacterized protein SERLADRAFT_395238 [Serpula lacrymans var. lacrymans S7.9]EGN96664.1 hypothetical protein SERLA73DRAFT_140336 [Serpula lacrymans var. lacrymans S7.3]EGO22283.1 hypothetical protein SERLADRAFT_395238 [Serpula lacrymans var. lacrymans S7.9]